MRAVIDTNVLLSALLWRGPPHALLEQAKVGDLTMALAAKSGWWTASAWALVRRSWSTWGVICTGV